MKTAGLDIGTTGCKCTVFDERGKSLGKAYRDYPSERKTGEHEIDAAAIMDGVCSCIREMALRYPDIAGIGITSFGETFVCTDEAGSPLHPAMLYTDPRGIGQCRRLEEALGSRRIAGITGLRPHEMYSISKIMWLKEEKPEIYAKAKHIFLMEDYVIYRLTGETKIDYSLAARTMAFDIRKFVWSEEIFHAAGVEPSLMAEPVPSGTVAGTVSGRAAEETGLKRGTKVISVGHDQIAAAVGAGAFDSSVAVDGAGTVECLTPIYDEMPDMETMYRGYFSVVPYVIPGKYAAYAFSYTGGALLKWCVDTLAGREKEIAARSGLSVNEYLESSFPLPEEEHPACSLLVLPHFAGAATPYMDTGSRGAILGLTTDTTVAEIYRACMEGVVYEMYLNMQAIQASGANFRMLHATGGGAASSVWMQMKADILDLPVTALKTADAGTVGSAMLTGVAMCIFQDLKEAASYMVEKTVIYEPRRRMHEAYLRNYGRYRKLYAAVRPLMDETIK